MNNRNLKNDLKPLSGVKGLAAIGITCLYHYKNVYSNQGVTDFWLIHFPIINWWADQGWILVELFFTISGMLFIVAYEEKIGDGQLFEVFMGNRIKRLFPMMILSSTVYFILEWIHLFTFGEYCLTDSNIWYYIISFFGFQVGWFEYSFSLNAPTWYISVLMQCYIVAFVLATLKKNQKRKNWLYMIPVILGFAIDYSGINFFVFNSVSSRGYISFFVGCLLMIWISREYGCHKTDKYKRYGTATICAWGGGVILIWILYSKVGIIVIGDIYKVMKIKFLSKVLSGKIATFLGDISFGIYLWNMPIEVSIILVSKVAGFTFDFGSISFFMIHFCIHLIIGIGVYYGIQKNALIKSIT